MGVLMINSANNKEAALSFLRLVHAGKIREAYDKYVAPSFRHHNPYFKGDRETLLTGMETAHGQFPHKVFDVQRVLADADLVVVHSHVKLKPGELEVAAVHLFRFQDGKVVELWDVGQQVPKDTPNQFGMF